jgi:hypothetical protein
MSSRRELRPHEIAKRDQFLADATARLRRGEGVIWTDSAKPGAQCCYCDCPLGPDSPHNQPGYICDQPCPAGAVYLVTVLSVPKPQPLPLCDRHYTDWCADFVQLCQPAGIDILGPWMDPE